MSKTVTVHYVDGYRVSEDQLTHYACYHCNKNIKDTAFGFIEDAYGNYYCEDDRVCRDAMTWDMTIYRMKALRSKRNELESRVGNILYFP